MSISAHDAHRITISIRALIPHSNERLHVGGGAACISSAAGKKRVFRELIFDALEMPEYHVN